jgi:hypothetical protein
MQQERRWVYAACTIRLIPDQPGCEAVFDQALTNGLAAIVAAEWPGVEVDGKGRVHSAAQLLTIIAERIPQEGQTGVHVIPDPDPERTKEIARLIGGPGDDSDLMETRIDVATLRDGIAQTQAVRHARGAGRLEERHVEALRALDIHESLCSLSSEEADRVWNQAREDDRASILRAVAHLDLIGEDAAAQRATDVDNPNAYHPKHNPDGHDLEECPVCGLDTFCVQGIDDYGYGFGPGQCLVCTYTRSRDTADEMALDFHITRLSAKD